MFVNCKLFYDWNIFCRHARMLGWCEMVEDPRTWMGSLMTPLLEEQDLKSKLNVSI